MGTVQGVIVGAAPGGERPIEARVHVLASTGQFRAPPDAVLKVGGGPDSVSGWVETEARFRAPEQRQRTVDLFRQAGATYARPATPPVPQR